MSVTPHLKRLVADLAANVEARVTRRVICQLRKITTRLSGDDSPLRDAWDEICVQVQGQESVFWSAYLDTIDMTITAFVKDLPQHELAALWLETDRGFDWLFDQDWDDEGAEIVRAAALVQRGRRPMRLFRPRLRM